MQIVINDVYKDVSKEMDRDYALIKSVGDSVFEKLLVNFKKPKTLILKVKGIGSFYLRKKKLLAYIDSYRSFYTDDTYPNTIEAKEKDIETYLKKQSQYFNMCDRIEEYERYSKKMKEIKTIRNQTQPIITPKNDNE